MPHLPAPTAGVPYLPDGNQPAHRLAPSAKDCPSEAWEQGPQLILGGELQDPELAALIQRSRQADRDDIHSKQAICQQLGIHTTALKGDGFTAYLPDMAAFANAMAPERIAATTAQPWQFHVSGEDIAAQVQATGAQVTRETPPNYAFISLRAAYRQRAPQWRLCQNSCASMRISPRPGLPRRRS